MKRISTQSFKSWSKIGAPVAPIIAIGLLAATTIGTTQPIQPVANSATSANSSQNLVGDFFSVSSDGNGIVIQSPGHTNTNSGDQTASDQSTAPGTDQTSPDSSTGDTTGNVSITVNTNQSFSTGDDQSDTGDTATTNSDSHSSSHISINSRTDNDGKTTGHSSSLIIQNGKVVQNTHHNF